MGGKYGLARMLAVSVLLTAVAALVAGAESGTRISETFNQPVGAVPEDWRVVKTGSAAVAEVTASTLPGSVERNGLLIQRPAGASHNAMAYYAGSRGSVDQGRMADFTATVVMNLRGIGASSSSGVVLRAQDQKYAGFNGYYVGVGGSGPGQGLSIFWSPESHVHHADRALVFAPARLAVGTDYLLRVAAQGEKIEASLWTLDSAGNADEQIAAAAIEDAEQASPGRFGLRGAYGNSGPIGTWFRDLHLEVAR